MTATTLPKINRFAKAALGLQVLLLQRNWLGQLGNFVMVITTTGRKTGQPFSTPIGYLRDGETYLSLSVGGKAHWYKNLLANPTVELTVKGQKFRVHATPVRDSAERQRIFKLYQTHARAAFPRLFGVAVDAPATELAQALAGREFVRFSPLA